MAYRAVTLNQENTDRKAIKKIVEFCWFLVISSG